MIRVWPILGLFLALLLGLYDCTIHAAECPNVECVSDSMPPVLKSFMNLLAEALRLLVLAAADAGARLN